MTTKCPMDPNIQNTDLKRPLRSFWYKPDTQCSYWLKVRAVGGFSLLKTKNSETFGSFWPIFMWVRIWSFQVFQDRKDILSVPIDFFGSIYRENTADLRTRTTRKDYEYDIYMYAKLGFPGHIPRIKKSTGELYSFFTFEVAKYFFSWLVISTYRAGKTIRPRTRKDGPFINGT